MVNNKTMIQKLTPPTLTMARKGAMVIKWRASGTNGTLIKNPTLTEMRERSLYQRTCSNYITLMMRVIISEERKLYEAPLQLKCEEYYHKRYDVNAVECRILRNEILSKLN